MTWENKIFVVLTLAGLVYLVGFNDGNNNGYNIAIKYSGRCQ